MDITSVFYNKFLIYPEQIASPNDHLGGSLGAGIHRFLGVHGCA